MAVLTLARRLNAAERPVRGRPSGVESAALRRACAARALGKAPTRLVWLPRTMDPACAFPLSCSTKSARCPSVRSLGAGSR